MVRCADCGFLSLRRYADLTLCETPDATRETGKLPEMPGANRNQHEEIPVCFAMATSLKQETQKDGATVLSVIRADRDCNHHVTWKQGYTPKEHQDMIDARELRNWQEELRIKDREWQAEQRRDAQRWQASQDLKSRRMQLWCAVIGTFVGAAVTLISVWLASASK
jgi:hypothetical protein